MQESAVHWWDALDDATKGSYKVAKTAFVAYFGGGQEVTATALTELANMQQGSESMVSFGARIKVTLAKIDTTMKEDLKLFFFTSLVRPQVAKEVSRYNPTTLNDAIGYAIKLEIHDRNTANHHNLLHKKTIGLSPNIPHFQSTTSDMTEPTPMEDVQATNSQRYKPHYKNNSSNSRPSYSNNNFTHSKKQQPQQQTAFETLKQKLATLPQLAYTDPNLPYEMHDDEIRLLLEAPKTQLFRADNNIIYFNQQNPLPYIPKTLLQQFFDAIHANPTSGHFGRDKTLSQAKQVAWWPSLQKDIIAATAECELCQTHKRPLRKYGELQSIPVGEAGEVWAMDIVVLPTSSKGNRYLLVCMEYLTKWVITVPLSGFDSNVIAQVLLYEIILKFPTPKKLISNNGTNFILEAMILVCTRLGIDKSTTSVMHPASDSAVFMVEFIFSTNPSMYVERYPEHWDDYLPFVTFGINTQKQSSMGYSLFEAMFGRKAILPPLANITPPKMKTHNSESWVAYLNHYIPLIYEKSKNNIQKAQQRQKHYYDLKHRKRPIFQVGDLVLRILPKENWKFPNPKFSGPWHITKYNNAAKTSYSLKHENKKGMKETSANQEQLYPFKESKKNFVKGGVM
ncbi:hypothetical protein INT45_013471 [Circinella minor]|uniref:Integrase catalytic domain-containing protein n=1 Tax=Circinella minor TaxID=1195481 RepID=A0A8H7S6J3_9FUNG|nr:hypothetical protein INT45_013471 [Circinella minor]